MHPDEQTTNQPFTSDLPNQSPTVQSQSRSAIPNTIQATMGKPAAVGYFFLVVIFIGLIGVIITGLLSVISHKNQETALGSYLYPIFLILIVVILLLLLTRLVRVPLKTKLQANALITYSLSGKRSVDITRINELNYAPILSLFILWNADVYTGKQGFGYIRCHDEAGNKVYLQLGTIKRSERLPFQAPITQAFQGAQVKGFSGVTSYTWFKWFRFTEHNLNNGRGVG